MPLEIPRRAPNLDRRSTDFIPLSFFFFLFSAATPRSYLCRVALVHRYPDITSAVIRRNRERPSARPSRRRIAAWRYLAPRGTGTVKRVSRSFSRPRGDIVNLRERRGSGDAERARGQKRRIRVPRVGGPPPFRFLSSSATGRNMHTPLALSAMRLISSRRPLRLLAV